MLLHSFLIGLVAGARSLTPLAFVSEAARQGRLDHTAAPGWLGSPLVSAGSKALAAGELAGDKWDKAPDRIVPAGMLARLLTGAIAGAALAPRGKALAGGLLGAGAATAAAYVTFGARMTAMKQFGQASTGAVEDALALGLTGLIVHHAEQRA